MDATTAAAAQAAAAHYGTTSTDHRTAGRVILRPFSRPIRAALKAAGVDDTNLRITASGERLYVRVDYSVDTIERAELEAAVAEVLALLWEDAGTRVVALGGIGTVVVAKRGFYLAPMPELPAEAPAAEPTDEQLADAVRQLNAQLPAVAERAWQQLKVRRAGAAHLAQATATRPLADRVADLDRYGRRFPVTAAERHAAPVRDRVITGRARIFRDGDELWVELAD